MEENKESILVETFGEVLVIYCLTILREVGYHKTKPRIMGSNDNLIIYRER
jgi:hypothetical protein